MQRANSSGLLCWMFLACCFESPVLSQQEPAERIGDGRVDARNPVALLWEGKRLDHWAWKSPTPASIPNSPNQWNQDWGRTPVDHFVLAKMQSIGLRPSKEADRRTLIRRVTFDVTGLPPTPEEVEAFQSDESVDAYGNLVDRLLSSPQYGMRWGRHWLDVVRYADTNGFERDEFRTAMWRYRDYVVHSLNADLPYDQFLSEQIAGDELANESPQNPRWRQQFTASGFLRLGPLDTTKSKFDTEEAGWDEWMVDLVNTTGSAFLGQTLACCRCHDHKTDPLLQADHYRLRAFFASIETDNEKIVDSLDEEASITKHNDEIDQKLKPLQEEYQRSLKPGKDRLTMRTIATFPADVANLLKQPEGERSAVTAELLAPYLKKLDFYDEDAAALLTDAERPDYEVALRHVETLETQKRDYTTVYCAKERASNIPPTHILEGGAFADRREEVQPGIFSLLDPNQAEIGGPSQTKGTGRRLALAKWIASPKNPWTARVMVNRIWHHHFGKGIVATPDDFGFSGSPPSHPELLDWLSVEFMKNDWSIKKIHRLILLSSTYRQSCDVVRENRALDPNNRLLARQNLRRMDAETLRDCILAVAGMLELTVGGAPRWPEVPESVLRAQPGIYENSGRLQAYYTTPETTNYVRSILLIRKRSVPLPFLSVFNLSDASGTCGRREVTINAPQALSLLNNPLCIRASSHFASRLSLSYPNDLDEQMQIAFPAAFGRKASPEELALFRQSKQSLFGKLQQRKGDRVEVFDAIQPGENENTVWERTSLAELCRAILNSNEFIFIE